VLPTIVTVNPFMAKQHRAHHKRQKNRFRHRARAKNAFRHHRRRRAKNPFSFSGRGITHDLTGALIGAGGAVLTDVAMAYLPVPASLQTGWMNLLTRAAVAVGVGYVAGMAVGRDTGKAVAAGGLIVVAYSGLKQALAPTLGTSIKGLSGLADFGDYTPASYQTGYSAVGAGLGAYMQPRQLGAYMNPAAIVSGVSPIRQKQMGAYMTAQRGGGFSGFGGYDSESM
jgi:hypothetical protein